jgi:hypothetical protein
MAQRDVVRDDWRRLVCEKMLDLLQRHTTPHELEFDLANRS